MKDIQKIGKIEAVALSLAIITNNIIFNITSIIFNSCGSGAWLNMIYVSILSLIFMFVILFLFRNFEHMCEFLKPYLLFLFEKVYCQLQIPLMPKNTQEEHFLLL